MVKRAYDVQEAFARISAFENRILWDMYAPGQFPVFKKKLEQLFRDIDLKGDWKTNKAMATVRESIYKSTISQTKYTNRNLLSTFILVTVAGGTTHVQAQDATEFSIHLLVRTRKCLKNDDSTGCCMIFIDEHGRVYKNWNHFMETNLLPEGVALAPPHGVYEFEENKLIVDSWVTPASGLDTKAAAATDVAAGVGGFAAAGVTLSALALPVAAPVLGAAAAVGLGAAVYTGIRSSYKLWARKDHEQSIGLEDQSARVHWLGLATGAFTAAASATKTIFPHFALAGPEVLLIQKIIVDDMNILTMILSGPGVPHGIVDLILIHSDDEKIYPIGVMQVAESLVIFTHSVYNCRLAAKTQNAKLISFRENLINTQRNIFEKIATANIRKSGETKGKTDTIRLVNEIPDKQYLEENGFYFVIDINGKIWNQIPLFHSVIPKPILENHLSQPNQTPTINSLTINAYSENSHDFANYCQTVFDVGANLILNEDNFQNCVQSLLEALGEETTKYLIEQAKEFLKIYQNTLETLMKTPIFFETVLWDLFEKSRQQLTNINLIDFEEEISKVFKILSEHYKLMSCTSSTAELTQCDICGGSYQSCKI